GSAHRRWAGRTLSPTALPSASRRDVRAPRARDGRSIPRPRSRGRAGWGEMTAILTTSLPLPLHSRGKVRDTYRLTDRELLMVSTDRISAFDVVLPTPIPEKGRVLN